RIRKVREGAADALVLARAGLDRLGLEAAHTVISPEVMLPAVGQGALAAATLEDHPQRDEIHAALDHEPSSRATRAERAMLRTLEGGCRVPVGALGAAEDGVDVRLRGIVVSPDGALVYGERLRVRRRRKSGIGWLANCWNRERPLCWVRFGR
ncbi:MAG: hypothetical protein M3475_00545, partial [Actinomycetota bacterium]|nr:hypothetical protein [Actinomycetota bacterium]